MQSGEVSASTDTGATDVLVVGAGPTGLAAALLLARDGVRVRIIDRNTGPAPFSRALGVHARTLEFYRQLGFADEVVAEGVIVGSVNLWSKRRRVARVPFGDIGGDLTRFPFVLDFAQDRHERLLIEKLAAAGVAVERETELVSLIDRGDAVETVLRQAAGTTTRCVAAYVAGCDGAHSIVRDGIGASFAGGTYRRLFYVADVVARGPAVDDGIHVDLDEADLLAVFDMRGEGRIRLVGTVLANDAAEAARNMTFADVARRPLEHLQLEVGDVNWFSTYHVHHRVAGRFSAGRVFLLGDAAHVHSPVGAQGMNTGIGDAMNLAWKLAAVIRDGADPRMLDTYAVERRAFATRLVATTDRAFEIATRPGRIAAVVRTRVFPVLVSILFRFGGMRRFLFRTVSQIAIAYHDSALSTGRVGSVRAGDRLPWVPLDSSGDDNHRPLETLRWQVHMYGGLTDDVRKVCEERGIEAHGFPWTASMRRKGLAPRALYLLRPDGYVALADPGARADHLNDYLDHWKLGRPTFEHSKGAS